MCELAGFQEFCTNTLINIDLFEGRGRVMGGRDDEDYDERDDKEAKCNQIHTLVSVNQRLSGHKWTKKNDESIRSFVVPSLYSRPSLLKNK